tara:strand:- start:400 stop:615 length:216 start_codon:yes stop_codon:yes gene_type:complete
MIDTDKYEVSRSMIEYLMQKEDDLEDSIESLLVEVKELQAWKAQVEHICRTMHGPSRDTALFIMTNEVEEE